MTDYQFAWNEAIKRVISELRKRGGPPNDRDSSDEAMERETWNAAAEIVEALKLA